MTASFLSRSVSETIGSRIQAVGAFLFERGGGEGCDIGSATQRARRTASAAGRGLYFVPGVNRSGELGEHPV